MPRMSDAEFQKAMGNVGKPPSCCWECATPAQRLAYRIVCKACGREHCKHALDHLNPCNGSAK